MFFINSLAEKDVSSTKILIAEDSQWEFVRTQYSETDPEIEGRVGILAAHD
jgi:hypothetical protein